MKAPSRASLARSASSMRRALGDVGQHCDERGSPRYVIRRAEKTQITVPSMRRICASRPSDRSAARSAERAGACGRLGSTQARAMCSSSEADGQPERLGRPLVDEQDLRLRRDGRWQGTGTPSAIGRIVASLSRSACSACFFSVMSRPTAW